MKGASSLANWRALDEQLGPDCLRVASYNVHGCIGVDGRDEPSRIADVIVEVGCDTVGLQEVHGVDLLKRKLNMEVIAGKPHLWHDRHVGNALLTRRRVLEVRHHEFGWPGREPRTALDVDLDVAGETVRVIVTHLGLRPAERRFQVRELLKIVKQTPMHERLVVLGDINEWLPLSRPLRWMNELFGHSHRERTFPSWWPLFALDRVWVRPRHALLALSAHRTPLAARASDHLPVKAIIATQEHAHGALPGELAAARLPGTARTRSA